MKTPAQVALALQNHLFEHPTTKTRFRLSEVSVANAAGVTKLHPSWVDQWIKECSYLRILVGPLDRGGFGAILTDALEGATPLTNWQAGE